MRKLFATAAAWLDSGRPFALGTVVALTGSRPVPLATSIAVALDGEIAGNIGAGCYEAAIVEAALQSAKDGHLRRLELALDGDELASGTSCGTQMSVIVWRPAATFATQARAIALGARPVYLAIADFHYVVAPKEPLIVIGATALAAELTTLACRADFHTTVIDPRPAFATRARLADADNILRGWPDELLAPLLKRNSAIAVLSHDPKLDVPALRCALRSEAWYIGLLGSRNAQAARRETLARDGFRRQELGRIRGPIGLDIGGRTDAEIALSILAEITALRHGHSGGALVARRGAVHAVD